MSGWRLMPTKFGGHMQWPKWPNHATVAIVGTCSGAGGIMPRRLVLPHQVYAKDILNMWEEHSARSIVVIPASSEDYLHLEPEDIEMLRNINSR